MGKKSIPLPMKYFHLYCLVSEYEEQINKDLLWIIFFVFLKFHICIPFLFAIKLFCANRT